VYLYLSYQNCLIKSKKNNRLLENCKVAGGANLSGINRQPDQLQFFLVFVKLGYLR
jgi:hypothetical protein